MLTPGGSEPHQLLILAECGKAPCVCLSLRQDPLASAVPAVVLVGPSSGDILVPFDGLPPGPLLLTPLTSGLVRLFLRHQPQQIVPTEPDPTIASAAGPPVPTIRRAALAAIPLLDRLLPLGDRQALELLAFIQWVSRQIQAPADGARPMLPRSRAERPAVGPTPLLRGPRPGSRSRVPIPFRCRFLLVRACPVACRLDWWQSLCLSDCHLPALAWAQGRISPQWLCKPQSPVPGANPVF